jgi:thioesterase domain-containing protein
VVEALRPTRSLNRNPLFDVLVSFLPQDPTAQDDPVLVSDFAALTEQEVGFPIVLSIEPNTEWIDLVFVFQHVLFSGERIQSLLDQLVSLLEQIIADPNQQIESYLLAVPSVHDGPPDFEIALEQEMGAEAPARPRERDPSVGAPSDLVEESLRGIWKRLLKRDNIGVKDDFFALGGHSLMAVRMFAQIQEALGVYLPLTCLFQSATIQHLASLIRELAETKRWSSLVEIQPGENKPPFFCVHGLTGDVFWFHGLVPHMSPAQPFWGVQSVGLDGIEQPLKTIESMAAHYVYEMRCRQPEGPYYIGGYSFGGSVAYEMARQLALQGQETALLVIIDHAAPRSENFDIRLSPGLMIDALQNVPYRVLDFLRQRPDQILARFIWLGRFFRKRFTAIANPHSAVAQQMTASELIDQAPALPAHVQRIIEINYNAISNYVPGCYPGVVTVLRARGGRVLGNHDPQMGWGGLARRVDVNVIPGSHVQLFRKPHIRLLAQQLQSCLDRAQADCAPERRETAPGT